MGTPRLLVIFTTAAAVVVAAFAIAIAVGEWWVVPAALVIHVVATGVVVGALGGSALADRDKPDPVTEARLEEEGAVESGNGSRRRRDDEERVFGH